MKLPKNKASERKVLKDSSRKSRKSVRVEIFKLWEEELEEKGFNRLNRLKQGLL